MWAAREAVEDRAAAVLVERGDQVAAPRPRVEGFFAGFQPAFGQEGRRLVEHARTRRQSTICPYAFALIELPLQEHQRLCVRTGLEIKKDSDAFSEGWNIQL